MSGNFSRGIPAKITPLPKVPYMQLCDKKGRKPGTRNGVTLCWMEKGHRGSCVYSLKDAVERETSIAIFQARQADQTADED